MSTIKQRLTTVNRTVGRTQSIKYIVVHYTTGSSTASGAALANCKYFESVNRSASAHYFIDDGPVVWQSVRDKDTAWSVGSKTGYKHPTARNANTLNIEVCTAGAFTSAETATLRWLVAKKMGEYSIPAANVIRHYDVTGKACPGYYVDSKRWSALHDALTKEETVSESTPYRYGVAIDPTFGTLNVGVIAAKCAALGVACAEWGPVICYHASLPSTIKAIEADVEALGMVRFHGIPVEKGTHTAMGVANPKAYVAPADGSESASLLDRIEAIIKERN